MSVARPILRSHLSSNMATRMTMTKIIIAIWNRIVSDIIILIIWIWIWIDKDEGANRRSAVDDDNANHATSSAVLKRTQRPKKTQPGATTDATIDIDNHSLTVSCREINTGAKGGGLGGSERGSNLMNDLDTTGSTTLDKNTDCFQEKQVRPVGPGIKCT